MASLLGKLSSPNPQLFDLLQMPDDSGVNVAGQPPMNPDGPVAPPQPAPTPQLQDLAGAPPKQESAPMGKIEPKAEEADPRIADIDAKLQAEQDRKPLGSEGSKHPGALGKIGHVLAGIGNIAGDIFMPGTMALIPGTQLHGEMEHQSLIDQRARLIQQNQQQAQANHEQALADALNNPKPDAKDATKTAEFDGKMWQFNPKTGRYDVALGAAKDGKKTIEEQAYEHAISTGMDPMAALTAVYGAKDQKNVPLPQQYLDAIASGDTTKAELIKKAAQDLQTQPAGTKTVQLQVGGRPHQVLIDERTGQTIRDLGESGEKPPTINVNANRRLDMAEKGAVMKEYTPALDSAERFNVMSESYEKAIKDHDQQAMLNLLANHLGMTMGLQKGARLTKDIIHEAVQSRPWLQGIKATFDKDGYLAGVTLSPQQMQQMVSLGRSRFAEDMTKARSQAQYLGVTDDGPARIPNKSTMRSYLAMANGDVNRAKQMAAEDGWTVK